ncbi:prephenate dehydrogenase/arogenate dehydrogenase family protein [Methylobacterium oryzisoli]|uniref:prephenate dehydrogenase/arogenate dehydrogenase family protein n=1 Tax=Methylobacterium oryzisoli TaxID=3385502 RepID=UPI00389203A1
MSPASAPAPLPSLGIVGFGAFGRLAARHLAGFFRVLAYDPEPVVRSEPGVVLTDLAGAAACPVVILAVPVGRLRETVEAVAPHLRPGALVLDVGSVKMEPARIMAEGLPPCVDVVATHPLFGPHSARNGIAGLKIAVCPLRGRSSRRAAAFLRRALGLDVILTTPEAHDREAALAQGLTHLIARVLVRMEPLPDRITTRSFDLIREAIGLVRHDAPEVFDAITRTNPYAAEVRRSFFALATALDAELGNTELGNPWPAPDPALTEPIGSWRVPVSFSTSRHFSRTGQP